jgi:carboxymethylenebutenolidase
MNRKDLLNQIQRDRQELQTVLNGIPDDQMEVATFPNGWSLKDFLGHLGFWEKRALEMFYYFKEVSIPEPKPGSLSLDEINAWAFSANQNLPAGTVRTAEQEAYQALIKLVEMAGEEELFDPQHFPLTDGREFFHWIEDNTFGHYQEHMPDLRGALNLPGWIHYSVDEQTVRAYTAHPKQGGPGVIVLHAWWGLNAFFQRLCDRLAEQGFVVFAPDLYEGKLANTVAEAEALLHDSEFMSTIALSAVERLRQQPGVRSGPLGVIGVSLGAAYALQLATAKPEDIAATVLFYGTNDVDFKRSRAAFQGHFAENDPYEPVEGVHALQAAIEAVGLEADFSFYPGTGHWFFEDDRPGAYQAEAASRAWERTLAFLKAKIGN